MGSSDRIPFYLNERFASADQNVDQSLWSRWLTDAMRLASGQQVATALGATNSADQFVDLVLGGLTVQPSGSSVQIAPGAIMQTTPFAPATDDPFTGVTLGFLAAASVEATPTPGADTWYLLECQAADVNDPAVSRDVWDPGTATWVPTSVVKRTRRELQFQFTGVDGVTTIPSVTAGWVPLAGVFRPGGGGVVLDAHLIDLRPVGTPQARGGLPSALIQCEWETNTIAGFTPATTLSLDVRIQHESGELFANTNSIQIDPLNVAYKNPADAAPVANEWWYLYLCPWPGGGLKRIRPRHGQPNVTGAGILAFTKTPPSIQGRFNSAPFTLPAPFGAATVATNFATCVASLRRDLGNTGWLGSTCTNGHVRVAELVVATGQLLNPYVLFTDTGTTNVLPRNARAFDLEISRSSGGTAALITLQDPTTNVQSYEQAAAAAQNIRNVFPDADLKRGKSYRLTGGNGADTWNIRITGFRL